ncbi:MAG: undecaprenyl-diphosphate phosphatase [FCB group bacterium]|nr:undecaprenyl-diphosphate phosphatase [FCB group bacterium]
MSFYDAVILGVLQGLTEFLPVSSSGHLVLAKTLLNVKESGISFEVMVHLGSLLAVLIYFRSKIILLIKSLFVKQMVKERSVVLYLIIATIPAVIAVLLFKDFFENRFSDPFMTSWMLLATGAILVSTGFVKVGQKKVSLLTSLIIGIGQAIAIIPGISRSGTTISTGMFAGVEPSEAAEFSFLMAIPAILGAGVFKLKELMTINATLLPSYSLGFVVTFITSFFAIYAVLSVIKKGKFVYFGYYCFALGVFGLYLFW